MKIFSQIRILIHKFSRSEISQICLLTFISSFLFSFQLGRESLWLDELYTYNASNTFKNLIDTLAWKERNMLLYHTMMYFWKFIGPGEVVMRSLSVLFAVLGVIAIYKLGKEIGGKFLGFCAASILLVNMFYIQYAQEARAYSLFAFFFILSSLYLIRLFKKNTPLNRNLYILFTVLSIYSHIYSFLYIGIQFIFLLWYFRINKEKIISFIQIYAIVFFWILVLFVPYLLKYLGTAASHAAGGLLWVKKPLLDTVIKQYLLFSSGSHVQLYLFVGLLGFLCINLFIFKNKFLRQNISVILYFLAIIFIPILFIFLFSILVFPLFVNRYFIFVLPAFVLLISMAIVSIRKRVISILIILIILALNINVLRFYYFYYKKEQWRDVVAEVNMNLKKGETVILFPYYLSLPYNYYNQDTMQNIIIAFPEGLKDYSPTHVNHDISDLKNKIGKSTGVWVITRQEIVPPEAYSQKIQIDNLLKGKYKNEEIIRKFRNLEIDHYSDPK